MRWPNEASNELAAHAVWPASQHSLFGLGFQHLCIPNVYCGLLGCRRIWYVKRGFNLNAAKLLTKKSLFKYFAYLAFLLCSAISFAAMCALRAAFLVECELILFAPFPHPPTEQFRWMILYNYKVICQVAMFGKWGGGVGNLLYAVMSCVAPA